MNKTKIDWAESSWNPVTGCLQGCKYCYACKLIKRFNGYDRVISDALSISSAARQEGRNELYDPLKRRTKNGKIITAAYPFGFEPTLYRYRLNEYATKKESRNIFVVSMGDLFGAWVSDEWIKAVFEACEKAPQHRYLFLTKNPMRYAQLHEQGKLPQQHWYGITLDHAPNDNEDETDWTIYPPITNSFVSIEPLIEDVVNRHFPIANWYIIGAETGNRKGKARPEREWIENIVDTCRAIGALVFMKSSLAKIWGEPLVQEFPWEVSK